MTNEAFLGDYWETHNYEGCFSIDLPFGTIPAQEDEGSTLVFPLRTDPHSEIIAGVFPSPDNVRFTSMALRGEIERFMAECAGVERASIETPADFEKDGFISYQAVGIDASGRWWIARVYGRRGGAQLLLVHWVGKESDAREHVLPVLVSIDPILS